MSSSAGRTRKFWLRITGFILGIVVLVWLPVEERSELGVLIISGAICIWSAIWFLSNPVQGDKQLIMRHAFIWAGMGLVLAPLAVLLMAVKSGIHGHGTPDFTASQVQHVLSRIPYFVLSGSLVGLGSGLWRITKGGFPQGEG